MTTTQKDKLIVRAAPLLVALLILLITAIQWRWITQDERYQPFVDPYPQRALVIADHLRANGLAELPQLIMENRIGPRSPLYQFGAAFFVLIFGRSLDVMLGLNLLLNGVMLVGAFGVGKLIKNEQTGLLAALLVATMPPILQLTRLIRPHSVLPALVMIWLWLLLRLFKLRTVRAAWLFCLILPILFWLHPNAIYLLLPATLLFSLVAIFSADADEAGGFLPAGFSWRGLGGWVRGRLQRPFALKGVLPGLLVAGVLSAAWYLAVFDGVLYLTDISSSNWSSERYGFGHVPASFFWYAWTMPGVLTNFFTYLFGAGLLVYLFAKRPYRFLLSLTFVMMYLGMGLRQGTLAWMNFAPVLPVVGVLTAVFVMDLLSIGAALAEDADLKQVGQIFAYGLLAVVILVAMFNTYLVTAEGDERSERLAQVLGAPLDSSCGWRMIVAYCPNPPRQQNWQEVAMLQAVLDHPGCTGGDCSLAVVNESAESFGVPSLLYYMKEVYPEAEIAILPIRLHGRYSLDWLRTDYVIYIPQWQNNAYSNGVAQFLQAPPAQLAGAYEQVAQLTLPRREWQAHVLHRTRPISDAEMAGYLAELDIPDNVRGSLRLETTFGKADE